MAQKMCLYLRQLREERRWHQQEVGARTGWGQPKVSRLENDKARPTFRDLKVIAKVFRRPLAEVLKVWEHAS